MGKFSEDGEILRRQGGPFKKSGLARKSIGSWDQPRREGKETLRSCHVTRKYCSSTTPIGGVGFAIM
jgi:hypothetical protein